jgi:hypothetical protein
MEDDVEIQQEQIRSRANFDGAVYVNMIPEECEGTGCSWMIACWAPGVIVNGREVWRTPRTSGAR